MLGRFSVAGGGRFGFEPIYEIRPHRLGTGALFGHSLDPVAEHGAGVGVDGAFDDALVVVNEETRRDEDLRKLLFHLVELDGAADCIAGATSQLTLVVNGRALFAQMDPGRQGAQESGRGSVKEIALVRDVGDPAVAFDFSGPSRTGGWGRTAGFFWHEGKLDSTRPITSMSMSTSRRMKRKEISNTERPTSNAELGSMEQGAKR